MPAARTRPAILADVCEALIGAVYLDGGFAAAAALIERYGQVRMTTTAAAAARPEDGPAGMGAGPRPADAGLSRGRPLRPGPRPAVSVAVQLPSSSGGRLRRSKRAAEQAAAAAMMTREGVKERLDG